MPEPWAAERSVDAATVGRIIARQFPALAGCSVAPLGEGWDNAAFLIGEDLVVRFPRRQVAVGLIETEVRVLPSLAPALPLPIPLPRFTGAPDAEYPWPFAGYALIAGRALSSARFDELEYAHLATACGRFLHSLHRLNNAVVPALGLDVDRIGRLDHARCLPKALERLRVLHAADLFDGTQRVEDLLENLAPGQPRLERLAAVHGDLYARHILVGDDARATGIIDWGDVHLGDPAVDLAVMFETFPPAARHTFVDAYGAIDDETRRLAQYRAIYHSVLVAHYGYRIGDAQLLRAGLTGLSWSQV